MMARALGKRLADLEALAPKVSDLICLVVHLRDCKDAKAVAGAEFVARYGHEPDSFRDVIFVSAQTKQSICGCPLADERNQHDKPENAH
jgi:hypothetical protein